MKISLNSKVTLCLNRAMQVITNDTLRQFALCLNAKSCYALCSFRRVLVQTIPEGSWRVRHATISINIIDEDDPRHEVRRSFPDGSYSLTEFDRYRIAYLQYNANNKQNGLFESWRTLNEMLPEARSYSINGEVEGLALDYSVGAITVYRNNKREVKFGLYDDSHDYTSKRWLFYLAAAHDIYRKVCEADL